MNAEDLKFVSDALLAMCERSDERPFFTDDAMRLKLKNAHRREPLFGHLLRARGSDPLLQSECHDVFEKAGLTERQRDVLLKRLDGWTFEEIGRQAGHTKQGSQSIFVQAIKKLARSFDVYPFRGLSEVYRRETRRGVRKRASGKLLSPSMRARAASQSSLV